MAKVVIRDGGDWLTVSVDGENVIEGHSASASDWQEVLAKCGIDAVAEDGDFCETCSEWTDKPQKGKWGTVCATCKEQE